MGICSSAICGNDKLEKLEKNEIPEKTVKSEKTRRNGEKGENKESEEVKKNEEIEETPVIEIYIRCPSKAALCQSWSESKQAAISSSAKVSSSLELIDIEDADELLADEQAENECGVVQPKVKNLGLSRASWPCKNRGSILPNDIQAGAYATAQHPRSSKLRQVDNCDSESSSLASGLPGSSGHYRRTNFAAPLPPPSKWQQVYNKKLKHREKRAEESLKKKAKKKAKKRLSKEEQEQAYKISLIKKIKNAIKKNAKRQESHFAPDPTTTEEYFERIFGVKVEDLEDNSSSSGSESSRSSSVASQKSSDGNLDEQSIGRFYKGDESDKGRNRARETHRWFGWKQNKVVPL